MTGLYIRFAAGWMLRQETVTISTTSKKIVTVSVISVQHCVNRVQWMPVKNSRQKSCNQIVSCLKGVWHYYYAIFPYESCNRTTFNLSIKVKE